MFNRILSFIYGIGRAVMAHPYHVLGPVIALLLAMVFTRSPMVQAFENQTVDWRFQFRASLTEPRANPNLLLVSVDEESLKSFGRWPWPRYHHGKLMKLMSELGMMPRVLTWDILFTEKTRLPRAQEEGKTAEELAEVYADDDLYLVDGMQWLPAVITGSMKDLDGVKRGEYIGARRSGTMDFGMTQPIPDANVLGDHSKIASEASALLPIKPVREISYFGFVDSDPNFYDGIRRTLPLLIRIDDQIFPSLVTQTMLVYMDKTAADVQVELGREMRLGEYTIPINERGEMQINYRDKSIYGRDDYPLQIGYFKLYSALVKAHEGEPYPEHYPDPTDRIVLVGQNAVGLADMGPNPLEAKSALVLTHLNALNNILQGDFLRAVPLQNTMLGWVLITGITLFGLREARILLAVGIPILLIALYIAFAFWLFWAHSMQIDLFGPVIAFGALHFGSVILRWKSELRSKQQVKQIFSAYVSPQVMNQVLDQSEALHLGGQTRPATVLFSDIRSFTTISEGLEPQELVAQLNEYFELMVRQVTDNRGTLHKFIGDAIMAAWGDVVSDGPKTDAIRAVRAAVGMRHSLADLNKTRQERGLIPWRIGIGLNHGNVMVGHLGATQRMEFTLIGDAVNLASRLEGLNKEFGTDIVVGETLNDLLRGEFLTRPLGLIKVVGKTKPVMVHEVMADFKDPVPTAETGYARLFSNALEAFLNREFQRAVELFKTCLTERPQDYTANRYLLNAQKFLKSPPDDMWDGVVEMKTK